MTSSAISIKKPKIHVNPIMKTIVQAANRLAFLRLCAVERICILKFLI